MKKKLETLYFGEIRKTVNMPPALWRQIRARLKCYEPELSFADWVRRIAQDELRQPVRPLADWSAQPKEPARDQHLKQAASSHKAQLLAALDRASDRIAIETPGNDALSIETLRKFFATYKGFSASRKLRRQRLCTDAARSSAPVRFGFWMRAAALNAQFRSAKRTGSL